MKRCWYESEMEIKAKRKYAKMPPSACLVRIVCERARTGKAKDALAKRNKKRKRFSLIPEFDALEQQTETPHKSNRFR